MHTDYSHQIPELTELILQISPRVNLYLTPFFSFFPAIVETFDNELVLLLFRLFCLS